MGGRLSRGVDRRESGTEDRVTQETEDRVIQESEGSVPQETEDSPIQGQEDRVIQESEGSVPQRTEDRGDIMEAGQSRESESHLKKTTRRHNLVNFFLAVLDRRDQFEEEERRCEDTHSVKDTLGASSILGLPGIRTRRRDDSILFAD